MEWDATSILYASIGAFVVLFFSNNYFNEPKYLFSDLKTSNHNETDNVVEPALPKFMTSRYQYNLNLLAYIIVSEGVYFLMVFNLPDLPGAEAFSAGSLHSRIILSTLIITGMLPNMPIIKQIMLRAKVFLHEKAEIPNKGVDAYHSLRSDPLIYKDKEIKKVLSMLKYRANPIDASSRREDLKEDDFQKDPESIMGRWAKLSYLIYFVNKWKTEETEYQDIFQRYIKHKELGWSSIEQSYDDLRKQILILLDNEEFKGKELLTIHLDYLLHRTYRLISCLLFITDRKSNSIEERFKDMGYRKSSRNVFVVPVRQISFVALLTALAILGGALFAVFVNWLLLDDINAAIAKNVAEGRAVYEVTTGRLLEWVVYGIPFLTLPVIFVLYAKRFLSFKENIWPVVTKELSVMQRQWNIYIVVIALAYLIGFATLELLIYFYPPKPNLTLSVAQQAKDLSHGMLAIWSLISMVTAAFVAYRLDSFTESRTSLSRKIALTTGGALFQGSLTAAVAMFAIFHSKNAGSFDVDKLMANGEAMGMMVVLTTMCFIIGCSLFVVSKFRKPENRHGERHETAKDVDFQIDGEQYKGKILNASSGGVLLSSLEQGFTPDHDIVIHAENSAEVNGKITNVKNGKMNIKFDVKDIAGVVQKSFGITPDKIEDTAAT
jgi:hypothetical protein